MTLLLIHAAATLYMTGLIWLIQVVHYPLLAKVGAEGYTRYQASHERLITRVVGPPMLIEMGCAIWLLIARPKGVPMWMIYTGLALVVIAWLSTVFLQVPQHHKLGSGFDPVAHGKLVSTNWIRTIAWSTRGALALWMIALFAK
jgi:uncharacterized membrane protein